MDTISDTSVTTVANAVAKKVKKLMNLSFSAIKKSFYALFCDQNIDGNHDMRGKHH